MATYYFTGNTNANWNVATNWSTISSGSGDGAIPTINDDAVFDANSPNCTIPLIAGSHPCRAFDSANYTRTMSFSDTIQTSGSITLGASATYNFNVVGTGFQIIGGGTLTSNGKSFASGSISTNGVGIVLTLADDWTVRDFNCIATINNNTVTVLGDLLGGPSGTTQLIMAGTGDLGSNSTYTSNITINTSGTITIGAVNNRFLYGAGTLTYTAGTIVFSSATTFTQFNSSCTLNVGGITFPVVQLINASTTATLLSDLNAIDFLFGSNAGFTTNGFKLNVARTLSIGTTQAVTAITLPNDLIIENLAVGSGAINGSSITVNGNLTHTLNNTVSGTTPITLAGTGTWSHSGTGAIQNNLTINTGGVIDITGTVYYNTGTITYTKGIVRASNATFRIGTGTFINMHKIPFGTVTITSGGTVTMNEFFNGLPNKRTTIQPSGATNYTITFQDNFPKFARNIKVSRATLSRLGQLTIITDKSNGGNNVGVRCYANQMPNGIPINNNVFQQNPTVFPAGGLLSDPAFI